MYAFNAFIAHTGNYIINASHNFADLLQGMPGESPDASDWELAREWGSGEGSVELLSEDEGERDADFSYCSGEGTPTLCSPHSPETSPPASPPQDEEAAGDRACSPLFSGRVRA